MKRFFVVIVELFESDAGSTTSLHSELFSESAHRREPNLNIRPSFKIGNPVAFFRRSSAEPFIDAFCGAFDCSLALPIPFFGISDLVMMPKNQQPIFLGLFHKMFRHLVRKFRARTSGSSPAFAKLRVVPRCSEFWKAPLSCPLSLPLPPLDHNGFRRATSTDLAAGDRR